MNEWVSFWIVMIVALAFCAWHEIEKGDNS